MSVDRRLRLSLRTLVLGYLGALLLVPVGLVLYRTFEHGDGEQHRERERQQHDGHRRGADRVVALDLPEDVHRRQLRVERDVARDQDDRAELADGAREAHGRARQDGRNEVGQHDAAEDRRRARAQ